MTARKILTFVIGCMTVIATAAQGYGYDSGINGYRFRLQISNLPAIGLRIGDSQPRTSEPPKEGVTPNYLIDPVLRWETDRNDGVATQGSKHRPQGVISDRPLVQPSLAAHSFNHASNPQPTVGPTGAGTAAAAEAGTGTGTGPGTDGSGYGSGSGSGSNIAGERRSTAGPTREPAPDSDSERFSTNLFQAVRPLAANRNMVYSPASLQLLLGLFFIGSTGQTAKELQYGAELQPSRQQTGQIFRDLLYTQQNTPNAQLKLATIVVYNRGLGAVKEQFKANAYTFFKAEIQAENFGQPGVAARNVNAWVSDNTNNRIRNLLSPDAIDAQTQALAITAVYFKAKWSNEFSVMDTAPAKFQVDPNTQTNVQMMYNDDTYYYGELPRLKAKAIELPYEDTDMSMLIILPNDVNGLPELEAKLARRDLNKIAARLRMDTVTVRIPKFQIEFDVDLEQPLRQLNITRIFGGDSEMTELFDQPVKISKIQQKAVLTVNEAGSEAAASSYAKFVPLSLPVKVNEFTADHPFFFAIRSPQGVLLIGHVINPQT